jgi:hypothetical protein
MKNVLFVLLASILAFGVVACSNDQATNATAEPAAGSAAAPDAAPTAAAPTPAAPAPAPAPAAAPAVRPPAPSAPKTVAEAPAKPAAPRMFEVPPGTELTVVLVNPISTATNKAGDAFTASLAEPIVVAGQTIAPKGALVNGRVVDAEGAGRVSGKANIRLVLTSIVDAGKTHPIVTQPFVAEADATVKRDAGVIGGAAGIGAAIGAIAGGKGGAAKGAIIGGAAGTGGVLATKGKEVEFDSESRLKFTLDKSVSLPRITS